jgi:hypothetical protein
MIAGASVLAAFYVHAVRDRMTRRTQYADKRFGVEVEPWMAEARRSCVKERLGRAG